MSNVKRESHTDTKNINSIKKELLQRKAELEEQLSTLYTEKVADTQVGDAGDQALSSNLESLRDTLQDSEVNEYSRIIQALHMIEAGTYGICEDCGNPIAEKRLKSYPNATRCIACQEEYEKHL
ncbi:TraR/DksA C4-type zinc finger protein [Candidatus Dependentiae bacterium]|nr:TraR/DksA C4-type zinc finger protein [Candidatus Dependentiae bacterium]